MPNTREKLIELIRKPIAILPDKAFSPHIKFTLPYAEELADHLIANGVTLDDQVASISKQLASSEWISVNDRLPEDGEIVLVCGSRGGVYTAVLNKPGQYNGWHKLNSKSHYCNPTHWMPLPQPPKGE
jgi:hypothetical protein